MQILSVRRLPAGLQAGAGRGRHEQRELQDIAPRHAQDLRERHYVDYGIDGVGD